MPSHRHCSSPSALAKTLALVALGLTLTAAAPAARAADPDAAAALAHLTAATASADRLAAAAELTAAAERDWAPIAAFLARTRTSTVVERRTVLQSIRASVPDDKGNFETPARMKAEQIRAEDDFDWLAALVELAPAPGLADTIADVAAIRALAALHDAKATAPILAAAFAAETMIYRDECGRYLRRMAPYSLPALIVAHLDKRNDKDGTRRRYATYQLERLDRQEPGKALAAAAGDESLRVAVLDAFSASGYREAVRVVFSAIDDQSARVRNAARHAVLGYVTGKAPPLAPKTPRLLPGGKTTKPQPKWFTYRELAEIELDKLSSDLLGEEPPDGETLEATAKKIFAFLDGRRAERDGADIASGLALASQGDAIGAAAAFDRVLALDPSHPRAAEMVDTYLAVGKAHEATHAWSEASDAYAKAYGIAPDGADAQAALAAHHYTLGKALEAAGKDGSADFRRAVEIKPDYAPAKAAAAPVRSNHGWMIFGSAGLCAGALVLLALGLARRR